MFLRPEELSDVPDPYVSATVGLSETATLLWLLMN